MNDLRVVASRSLALCLDPALAPASQLPLHDSPRRRPSHHLSISTRAPPSLRLRRLARASSSHLAPRPPTARSLVPPTRQPPGEATSPRSRTIPHHSARAHHRRATPPRAQLLPPESLNGNSGSPATARLRAVVGVLRRSGGTRWRFRRPRSGSVRAVERARRGICPRWERRRRAARPRARSWMSGTRSAAPAELDVCAFAGAQGRRRRDDEADAHTPRRRGRRGGCAVERAEKEEVPSGPCRPAGFFGTGSPSRDPRARTTCSR